MGSTYNYNGLSSKQSIIQKQKFGFSAQLFKKLSLLRLPLFEFREVLQKEGLENPFLELESPLEDSIEGVLQKAEKLRVAGGDIEESFYGRKGVLGAEKSTSTILEETVSDENSTLVSKLILQLRWVYNVREKSYHIGEEIISRLTKEGFFKEEEIVRVGKKFGVSAEAVEAVLRVVKNFEPTGIAAADIKECLLQQLADLDEEDGDMLQIEKAIIGSYFSLLEKKEYKKIAKHLGVSVEEVATAAQHISFLDPRPGTTNTSVANAIILPDLIVEIVSGKLEARVNQRGFPRFRYNKDYAERLWKLKKKEEKEKHLDYWNLERVEREQAKLLLDVISFRESNLMKVGKHLLKTQQKFFLKGERFLKPYTLTHFAEEIGLNKGTVSRIVNGKYLQCRWGLFSLKVFFSTSIPTEHGEIASSVVKGLLKDLIEMNPGKRLSDTALKRILDKKGYHISRRTVTKYRNTLNLVLR